MDDNRPNEFRVVAVQLNNQLPAKVVCVFEGMDRWVERTGELKDALPGDLYELRKVERKEASNDHSR